MAALPAGPPPTAGGPPASLELGNSFGVMLLSTIVVSVLYGVTVMQTWYYYNNFSKDSWILKLTVATVWVLDTLTIVLDSHAVYYYLIDNFNNPSALGTQVWSAQVEVLITYTVVLIVQLFFVWRIYQLRPYAWYIPLAMGVISVASYGLIIVIVAHVLSDTAWSDTASSAVNRPLVANWVLGMVVDIAITVVLCWYLWREKVYVRHGTHRLLNRIIMFSVNRGAIAAVVQVLTFLTKLTFPQSLVWIAFHNALCKVYANAMLATLNSRVSLRGMMTDVDGDGTELTQSALPTSRQSMGPIATLQFAPNRTSTFETRTVAWDESVDDEKKTSTPGAMRKSETFDGSIAAAEV